MTGDTKVAGGAIARFRPEGLIPPSPQYPGP